MNLLLDTHVLLWTLVDDGRITPVARRAIQDTGNTVHVSAASAWEIAIKAALKRVRIPGGVAEWLPEELQRSGFTELPILIRHALAVERLPRHHADPFDRLLIAQAKVERLTLVTHDRTLRRYDVAILST